MQILPVKTGVLKANFNLLGTLGHALVNNKIKICEGDVLILSSKIVALSEGRIFDLDKIKPSGNGKKLKLRAYDGKKEEPRFIELVLHEADAVLPNSIMTTLKNGMLVPAAGLDRSNIPKGLAIGWPKKPQKSANEILRKLKRNLGIKKLGVILCDSHCQPLRWGVTGLAIAWVGFFGVEDARGKRDIYDKKLKVTKKAVADNLACAALVVMGEADEKIPFVIVRGAPVKFTNHIQSQREIFIKPSACLFNSIYNKKFLHLVKLQHVK